MLKPRDDQEAQLNQYIGHARFAWNKLCALNLERLHNKQKLIRYYEADYWSKLWKYSEEYGFLKELPSHCLQRKLKDLDKAFKDGFDKSQPLKGISDSIRFPQDIKIDNKRVRLPKLGWIGFFKSQNIEGKIKNATVSRKANNWYVSIQVEQDIDIQSRGRTNPLGIDMGVNISAALSNGKKLAKAQYLLCRNKKDSKNLTISNMSKSAKGTVDNPGKNVKAKSGLNKSILDQAWGEFARQLEYKLMWSGGELVKVPPAYTSQICSVCRYQDKENRNKELFRCKQCDHAENADINAAKNILAAGCAVLACGEDALATSMKQEPLVTGDLIPA